MIRRACCTLRSTLLGAKEIGLLFKDLSRLKEARNADNTVYTSLSSRLSLEILALTSSTDDIHTLRINALSISKFGPHFKLEMLKRNLL